MSTPATIVEKVEERDDVRLSASHPIDLNHLAQQTMGDKELELEILALFAQQVRAAFVEMTEGDLPASAIAHRIKGSAHAVGAFRVAEIAARVESGEDDAATLRRFGEVVAEAEIFIAGFGR